MLACYFCYGNLKQSWRLQRKCLEAEEWFAQVLSDDMRKNPRLNQEQPQISGYVISPIEQVSTLEECENDVKEEIQITLEECESYVKEEIQTDTETEDDSDELEEEHESEAAAAKMSNIRKRKLEKIVPDKETMDELSETKLSGTNKAHTCVSVTEFKKPVTTSVPSEPRGPGMKAKKEQDRRRVTFNQLEALWEILNKNRDLATGFNKTSQAREYSRRMWKIAADSLNAQDDGAEKDWKGWCKYWNDYKSKLKSKVANARAALQKNEGGPSNEGRLTDLEIKYLQILGDDFGANLPRVKVEPFDIPIEDWIKAESAPQFSGQRGESDSIMAHHLIIEPLIPSERTAEEPPPATSPPSSPAQAPSPHASSSPHRKRHRQRRMKPISADAARRALVNTSGERLRIEERRNQILENLIHEIREIKYILINRLPAPPSADEHA